MNGGGNGSGSLSAEQSGLTCLRCGAPMSRIRIEEWRPGNLLLSQVQKIIDGASLHILRCTSCGRLEFFKRSEN